MVLADAALDSSHEPPDEERAGSPAPEYRQITRTRATTVRRTLGRPGLLRLHLHTASQLVGPAGGDVITGFQIAVDFDQPS